MYQSPPEGTALCWLGCSRCDRFLFEIEKTTVILYWVPALRFRMVQGRGLCVYRCGFFFRSHLHSFLCRILSRAWVPCEAWRPMTTPTTRPAAGRGAGRARGKEKKVGAVCRGAAGAACGAEGAAFVVEARSGFLFLHNSVLTQEPFTRRHLIPDTV